MSAGRRCIANVGAEEGLEAGAQGLPPAAERVARLFEALVAEDAGPDWLPGGDTAVAWLNTEAAERESAAAGVPLFGAPAEIVRRVHDKAFAHETALREGLVPECLRDCITVLSPAELQGPETVERAVAGWPGWARRRFTVKPRLGCSGRGRIAGAEGRIDAAALSGALSRLRARGGAIVEPWIERREDLSVQMLVGSDGAIRLLGSLDLHVDPSGLYRGHGGEVDARGRVRSTSPADEAVREAGAYVARAAAAAGYRGPCGIDAFVFHGPVGEDVLRPVVELNARFTVGILALAAVRRALADLRSAGLAPGSLRGFRYSLEPPGLSFSEES